MSGRRRGSLLTMGFVLGAYCLCLAQANPTRGSPAPRLRLGPIPIQRPARVPAPDYVSVPAVNPVRTPDKSGLQHLVRAAGIIFSGTVTRIERRPPTNSQTLETVAITFHVESALRGTVARRNLTLTEWIGLWSAGQRYRVGERVFVFFYPRSRLGLTSLVAGPMGRFDVDSQGYVLLSPRHLSESRSDPVLGGKSRVRFSDFASAVRRASEEE